MASGDHLTDSGIEAGSEEGITLVIILVFLSISFYNVLELTLITFATFRKRSGLYFWSFILSTWGVAIWSLGFLLKYTGVVAHIPNNYLLYMTFVEIGWVTMVTGQSFVLYSRLHIIMRSRRKLQMALGMIITVAIVCHVPIIVVAFGTNSPNPGPFIVPYSVYEKVQVTIFFIQELILSGIYIHETLKMMRIERHTGVGGVSRWLMKHLIIVNLIIVALDVTILGLEYAGYYQLQTAYKGLVYSVKLKLEFSILNRLVEMVKGGGANSSGLRSGARGQTNVTKSRVDKAGIPMDKLDKSGFAEDERGDSLSDPESGGIGYNAYAQRGMNGTFGHLEGNGRPVITRTTEVVVHRSDRDDGDSLDAKSGVTDDIELPRRTRSRRTRDPSTSSSEIQFAKA